MACCRFSLPSLRLTKRPTFGPKSYSSFQRGVHEQVPPEGGLVRQTVQPSPSGGDNFPEGPDDFFHASPSDPEEPTCYELESKSTVAGWQKIRMNIHKVVTEAAALPHDQSCLNCENLATLRCQQCGPLGFFCHDCFERCHRHVNFFHVSEKWEEDHFVPLLNEEHHVDVRPEHNCSSKQEVLILCLDDYGIEHRLLFTCCDCECIATTLTRANLWPATPHNPRYAFSFALLDWAESLMLECQVALKDFCNALKFRCPFHISKRRNMYATLINSFEEYRYLKHNLRHLSHLSETLDSCNVCPACPPKGKGKNIFAMDALFGLPRKKSAGISHRDPLHGDLFFSSQSEVDQFVADSENTKSKSHSKDSQCNDFLAGNVLRSASRYTALDETAVYGCCCRHEFPGIFVNLKHGERLAYAVWMLEKILQKYSGSDVFVMYDIACTLFKHLKSSGRTDILEKTHLCIPTFHSYGHQVSCQIIFGPRRCVGIGLSDGETMERLWSYLRRFAKMSKEMRPSHRIDVLTSALVYYGMLTKEKLFSLLVIRWERACSTQEVAEETIHELMPGQHCHDKVVGDQVNQWLAKEVAICQNTSSPSPKVPQWQILYFQALQNYYTLRNKLSSGSTDRVLYGQMLWLDNELKDMERKQSLPSRWLQTGKQYMECECVLLSSKTEQLLLLVWKAGQRRMFLLNLKKKYADGQKIAKKLCSQISRETKSIKYLLSEYHTCLSITNASSSEIITLPEAFNPSTIAQKLRNQCCSVASGKERQIIDAYLLLCRSAEEIAMIQEEARCVVSYYEERKQTILKLLEELSGTVGAQSNTYSRGTKSLLHQLLTRITERLELAIQMAKIVNNEVHRPTPDDDDLQTWSDIDSCSDTDVDD